MGDVPVDLFASEQQYLDHLLPIWRALPEAERDRAYLAGRLSHAATDEGLGHVYYGYPPPADGPVLVASFQDCRSAERAGRRIVYVEHGAGQCLAPETRVLTADLRHVPAGQLRVGDQVVAFDEAPPTVGHARWRAWRTATVTALALKRLPCYELEWEDGTVVVASEGHRWLCRDRQSYEWTYTRNMQDAERWPTRATKTIKCFDVWDEDATWAGGYLAAAFDGEGHFTQTPRIGRQGRMMLGFTQKQNGMLDEVQRLLAAGGFRWSESKPHGTTGVVHVTVLGGTREALRFVGTIRPRRLLANLRNLDGGQMRGEPVALVRRTAVGERTVVAIQTSTGTLIAEGMASHNSYDGDPGTAGHPSYSGSGEHDGVVLFVCPSETVAGRWRARYPHIPAVAVGSPRLDAFHERPPARRDDTVAVSFHADVRWVPETASAWNHYLPGLPDVVDRLSGEGLRVLGHAHPRLFDRVAGAWETMGAVPTRDFADVLRLTGAYAVDNSSTLYEAAAVGIPVVAMNAPWYRRDVEHGLRFWSLIPGETVDGPDDLADALLAALWDPSEAAERRRRVTAEVYAAVDGKAAYRAAEAVLTLAR